MYRNTGYISMYIAHLLGGSAVKVVNRQKIICRLGRTGTNTHLWHFFGTYCNVQSEVFV